MALSTRSTPSPPPPSITQTSKPRRPSHSHSHSSGNHHQRIPSPTPSSPSASQHSSSTSSKKARRRSASPGHYAGVRRRSTTAVLDSARLGGGWRPASGTRLPVGIAELSSSTAAGEDGGSSTSDDFEDLPSIPQTTRKRWSGDPTTFEGWRQAADHGTDRDPTSPSVAAFPLLHGRASPDQEGTPSHEGSTHNRPGSPVSSFPLEGGRSSPSSRSRHSQAAQQLADRLTNPWLPLELRINVTRSTSLPLGTLTRTRLESALIVGAVLGSTGRLWARGDTHDIRAAKEMLGITAISIAYVWLRAHPWRRSIQPTLASSPGFPAISLPARGRPHGVTAQTHSFSSAISPPTSPAKAEAKDFIWGTDARDYRECPDDGALMALLFGPLVSSSLLITTLRQLAAPPSTSALPSPWLVEPPMTLSRESPAVVSVTQVALEALARSRRSMLSMSSLLTVVLLLSLLCSRGIATIQAVTTSHNGAARRERDKWGLPKSEWKRTGWVVACAFAISTFMGALKLLLEGMNSSLWQDLMVVDIVIASLFHQFSLYVCVRLARRGFTLGELSVVALFSSALFMEVVNLTRAKINLSFLNFLTTPYVQTYRFPTPLLIYQLALIPGSFIVGILLSPLLVLSRYISQKPVHRLRLPSEKITHRRYLALGFYAGTIVLILGPVGLWTKWQLGWRDPWAYIFWWLLAGRTWWTRPALLSYWGTLASIGVGGWELQLAKSRKNRSWTTVSGPNRNVMVVSGTSSALNRGEAGPVERLANEEGRRSESQGASLSTTTVPGVSLREAALTSSTTTVVASGYSATSMLGRVPILSLNGRRKFFHGLAVLLFIPGIYVDPAFTHIAFSLAFSLFIFAEYVRYFALYPFGAVVHLFLNEFLNSKDSGTAILSHFYLLTGCALGLWLESPSPILCYVGVLTLGIGDAAASIVGRRYGRHRWSTTDAKTVEGTIAFFIGVLVPAVALRIFTIIPSLNVVRFTFAIALAALLEAVSCQNDNLVVPLYTWAVASLLHV